jgi:hypothetical protein
MAHTVLYRSGKATVVVKFPLMSDFMTEILKLWLFGVFSTVQCCFPYILRAFMNFL